MCTKTKNNNIFLSSTLSGDDHKDYFISTIDRHVRPMSKYLENRCAASFTVKCVGEGKNERKK
jgi:hypothetical protein